MNVLLLVGKTSTSHEAVAAEAEELRRQGHRVVLGTRVPPLPVLAEAVDAVVQLQPGLPAPASTPSSTPAPGSTPTSMPAPGSTPTATPSTPAASGSAGSGSAPTSVPAPGSTPTVSAATPDPAPAASTTVTGRASAPADPLRRTVATARRRVRRLRGQVSGAVTEPARSWRSVRRSPAALAAAAEADVVVAVDAPMVRAAWHLGQRLPLPGGPEVVYGLPAAASALARRSARTP